ncbi:MAG: AAA family ATPase [Actinomycetota bacterium]
MSQGAVLSVDEPDGELLERSAHLAALDATMAAVRDSGRGCLLLVSGQAGVGKTALLRSFCDRRRNTERILWGACDALFTPRPLGPFLEIAQGTAGQFEAVVTGAAKPAEVAAALIREVARDKPTILVLEDVHWADEATLDVLRLLTRRIEQMRTLLVATYRDDELDRLHPLRLVLGELRPGPTIRRLAVEPLTFDAVQQLATASNIDAIELYRATAGNPFFVTEVLAAPEGAIPNTVRDAILGRTARLTAGARTVLDAVAVTPPRAELWLLRELVGEASTAVDECLSAGMVTPVAGGIAFRHELARRAVEDSVPPHRLADLHRKALNALAVPMAGAPDLARLAHHAEGAHHAGSVLRYAPAAALHAASRGGHREAAAQYARALRFAGDATTELRADLLERLSQECYLTDQMDDAIDALQRAVACRRELGDSRGGGAALCALASRFWCAGDKAAAEEAGRAALQLLETQPPGRELALAYSLYSQLALNAEDATATLTWGTRAMLLAEQLGDVEIITQSLNNMGTIELLSGGSSQQLERSLRLAERAGLDDHVGRAFINLTWAISRTRSNQLAHWFDRGIESCDERGLELWSLYVAAYSARFSLDQGRWAEASEAAAMLLRYPRSAPLLRLLALCINGLVRARRGDPARWEPLDEALDIAAGCDELQWVAPVALARAEAAWLEGLGAEAVTEATDGVVELARRRGAGWVSGELAFWRRLAGVDEQVPEGIPEPFALQLTGHCVAAAERWTALGCPYEAALSLGGADDDLALRRALDELRALGARPAATIVARRLRERGANNVPRGPRQSTRRNPANLTTREVDVLKLLAQGLRNAEIADRMFVADKTVHHHVSAILRKLEVRTRGQAAVEADRLGVLRDGW